jgi:outer membrane lipoprotein-sorting protein
MADCNFAEYDFLANAQARFAALANYEATVRSSSSRGDSVEARYRYLKPGFIRMDFIRPHPGAVLVYSPETDKVTLWPFGLHRFAQLDFAPDNPLIQGPNAHRIDRSDIGTLLSNVHELQRHGHTQAVAEEGGGAGRAAQLTVTGEHGFVVAGVGQYRLWLDLTIGLPVKVVSADSHGQVIETVFMDDLRIDVPDLNLF